MKHLYSLIYKTSLFFFAIFLVNKGIAQCPNSGAGGTTAYDTTIRFGSGIVNKVVKFPKFDPQTGMVTCVRLCVTIKGIIDTVALENFSNADQTGSYTYTRKDTIRGPGIPTFLTSAPTNLSFGPHDLDETDYIDGSGPDFYSHGPDTVLTKVLCGTISDSATIAQFYGANDSVSYSYNIDATAVGIVSGGSSLAYVRSSALVNFHFEYCTCPATVLPINIYSFNINKLTPNKVELQWSEYEAPNSNYHYEVEVSRNAYEFTSVASFNKNSDGANDPYRFMYTASDQNGMYYFRIKQVYLDGQVFYSNIRQVKLESSGALKFSLYPNPSNGIVGIKFDNNINGQFDIQIFNTQGQVIVKKDIVVTGSVYTEVTRLNSGVYWLRLTDKKSQASCVNQLFIK